MPNVAAFAENFHREAKVLSKNAAKELRNFSRWQNVIDKTIFPLALVYYLSSSLQYTLVQ